MNKNKKDMPMLLGENYTTEMPFEPYKDDLYFRLKPKKLPLKKLYLNLLLFQLFGCGISALVYFKGDKGVIVSLLPAVLMILTSIIYVLVMHFTYKSQQEKGDVLVYDFKDKTITLPRQNAKFPVSNVYLAVVTGWIGSDKVSELQLVNKDSNERRLILTSMYSFNDSLAYFLVDIRKSIPVEIKNET